MTFDQIRQTSGDSITQVRLALRHGFGVEDISIELSMNVKAVRDYVQHLRKEGSLKFVLGVEK